MISIEQGCIDIWIDEVVPCLKDTETGDLKETVAPNYYKQPNPYVNAPSCHVNLLELSRYAKRCGKKLVDLTQDEVKPFAIF